MYKTKKNIPTHSTLLYLSHPCPPNQYYPIPPYCLIPKPTLSHWNRPHLPRPTSSRPNPTPTKYHYRILLYPTLVYLTQNQANWPLK